MRQKRFRRSWTIADNQPQNGMKTVTVSVTPIKEARYGKLRSPP